MEDVFKGLHNGGQSALAQRPCNRLSWTIEIIWVATHALCLSIVRGIVVPGGFISRVSQFQHQKHQLIMIYALSNMSRQPEIQHMSIYLDQAPDSRTLSIANKQQSFVRSIPARLPWHPPDSNPSIRPQNPNSRFHLVRDLRIF